MSRRTSARADWLLVAHRGASAHEPENTMAAFDLAQTLGADAIECDVRITADDVPVVFHDDTLERLTGVSGRLADLSATELRRLQVGGSPIPTLAELLAWSVNGLPLIVEVKAAPDPERVAAAIAKAIVRANGARILTLSSFDEAILRAFAVALPGLPRALISAGPVTETVARADELGVTSVHCHWRSVLDSPGPSRLSVVAWTVDSLDTATELVERGVAGIMTNNPALLGSPRWRQA